MHFASFDLRDPTFEIFGCTFSAQITTLENLYGLDPDRTKVVEGEDGVVVRAEGLAWAGQQERAEGEVEIRLWRDDCGDVRARISARANAPIRCVKLLLRRLAQSLAVLHADGSVHTVGALGHLVSYPMLLPAPLLCVRSADQVFGLRFEDGRVREKRFAIWTEHAGELDGRGVVEMIHEEDATRFGREIESPVFVISGGTTPDSLAQAHAAFAERELGLVPWERRQDVPAWAREIRLVATLHGMHFTGRVFLRYGEMLDILRFLCERIPGRCILAYLPGWEGRYYWQYGDYRPEPRLGGAEGFAAFCDGARSLGVHVMPMFGANCANVWLPRVSNMDPAAYLTSASGNRFLGNQPDWDLSRSHDTGWQAWFNPGHPGWREELTSQITALAHRFGFDAVFLDTVHVWINDPGYPVYEGVCALAGGLRRAIPGLLLAGEADYDALLALFALFQRPWWGKPAPWTARYIRRFGHLCEGEPRGFTGVHEAGVYFPAGAGYEEENLLPTIAFQDGTLESQRENIESLLRRLSD